MILQTGGAALGEISTKSSSCSSASSLALLIGYTPISTLSPTNRTSGTSILSLILCRSSFILLQGFLGPFLRIAIAVKFYPFKDG